MASQRQHHEELVTGPLVSLPTRVVRGVGQNSTDGPVSSFGRKSTGILSYTSTGQSGLAFDRNDNLEWLHPTLGGGEAGAAGGQDESPKTNQ